MKMMTNYRKMADELSALVGEAAKEWDSCWWDIGGFTPPDDPEAFQAAISRIREWQGTPDDLLTKDLDANICAIYRVAKYMQQEWLCSWAEAEERALDAAEEAIEKGAEIAGQAAAAAELGEHAVKALRHGDYHTALDCLNKARKIEGQYGDDPAWRPVYRWLEEALDAAEESIDDRADRPLYPWISIHGNLRWLCTRCEQAIRDGRCSAPWDYTDPNRPQSFYPTGDYKAIRGCCDVCKGIPDEDFYAIYYDEK